MWVIKLIVIMVKELDWKLEVKLVPGMAQIMLKMSNVDLI